MHGLIGSNWFIVGNSSDQILLVSSCQELDPSSCRLDYHNSRRAQNEDTRRFILWHPFWQQRYRNSLLSNRFELSNTIRWRYTSKLTDLRYSFGKQAKMYRPKILSWISITKNGQWMMNRLFRTQDAVSLFMRQSDLENETTLSFFNGDDYEKFKANPEEKWM